MDSGARTMSRPQKREYKREIRYQPPICTACAGLLPLATPPRVQNVIVTSTRTYVRHLKCENCGRCWMVPRTKEDDSAA